MLSARQMFLTRTAALAMLLFVWLCGIQHAQAIPHTQAIQLALAVAAIKQGTIKQGTIKPSSKKQAVPASKKSATKATPKVNKQRTGEQIYRQLCASCHGAQGQGGKRKKPLAGDLSVGELARFIKENMPPGADPPLPAADARKVAEYIYDAFYSPLARERNKPARVELSRLTVRQYRNVVTDLIGSFRKPDRPDERRGLRARYFKTRQGGLPPVLERIDPEIRFDFGTGTAIPEQDDPYQFVMHWQGSVFAPDTGEYEFIVRTDQAASLWINDLRQPLIDARVKSGSGNEYRASMFLLGGRLYPLRVEFFKGVTGVDNLKKLKAKPVQPASIALEWRLPHLPAEVIPQRCLFPIDSTPKFVAKTPFPPDDRSVGYERGTAVSKAWAEATTEAALEVAAYVAANLRELSGIPDNAPNRDVRLRAFCWKFVGRAFRRPLTDEQGKFFIDRQFQKAPNIETAVKRVVLLTLKSPRFLYREIATFQTAGSKKPAAPDPYDTASRLSFALWDSLPDQELINAAARNE
ncbi:MAG: PA14 domain-containing protein, partial [Armatimonadota bacterium]|nr:PA14 domain-containing protein [Armatimonadota bacterium]